MLYRYCNKCERSLRTRAGSGKPLPDQLRIREVMTTEIYTCQEHESLQKVMEGLSAYRFGAVLIKATTGLPAGVVSKTDLILAYKHGLPTETRAQRVMTCPVQACNGNAPVVDALKTMIFMDLHRLFVYKDFPQNLVGVLSLSDVARFRSGTCRACLASRLIS